MDTPSVRVRHSLVFDDDVHVIIQVAWQLHFNGTVNSQHSQLEACMPAAQNTVRVKARKSKKQKEKNKREMEIGKRLCRLAS